LYRIVCSGGKKFFYLIYDIVADLFDFNVGAYRIYPHQRALQAVQKWAIENSVSNARLNKLRIYNSTWDIE
jgi:hypothetical protein